MLARIQVFRKGRKMIREIINFTNDLLVDVPDVITWNAKPDNGIHVFIDIDENGEWTNRDLQRGKDYVIFDDKSQDFDLIDDCVRHQEASCYILANKLFDSGKGGKQILSCSPFSISYKLKLSDAEKETAGIKVLKPKDKPQNEDIEENNKRIIKERNKAIRKRIDNYKRNAFESFGIKMYVNKEYIDKLNGFYSHIDDIMDAIEGIPVSYIIKDDDYIHINLRSVPIDFQQSMHDEYVKCSSFISKPELQGNYGALDFDTTYNEKKPFLRHLSSYQLKGISQKFSKADALAIFQFQRLCFHRSIPNPLPIVIDDKETSEYIVKTYNKEGNTRSFHQLMRDLYTTSDKKTLSDFYLLHLKPKPKDIRFIPDDLDFVPMFRYFMPKDLYVLNATSIDKGEWGRERIEIKDIFAFESRIVSLIFNNQLVRLSKDGYSANYFGELKVPKNSNRGVQKMFDLILAYRKSIYDFIYKSDLSAISGDMFENIMTQSILTNIEDDDIKYKRFSINYNIKAKLNIWFSLYNFFKQRKTQPNMAEEVPNILDKTRRIADGSSHIDDNKTFAFAAGQLASYLIDCSEAGQKTYAMLEPYLQKYSISQVQDCIAQNISIYKHNIWISNGKFKHLASEVLTYTDEGKSGMESLLKYFLAGCFCDCVIYSEKTNKENE